MSIPDADVVEHSILTAAHIGAEAEALTHLVSAARRLRTVWPDAAEIVVDAGAWIERHGRGITLLSVHATDDIVLWSTPDTDDTDDTTAPPEPDWPEHRQVLERELRAALGHASPQQQTGWQPTDLDSHPRNTGLYRILLPDTEKPLPPPPLL